MEYASVIDPETLIEVQDLSRTAVLVLAVRIGETRLIDNAILQP
jgi:pantoate--beta-alanine ligase